MLQVGEFKALQSGDGNHIEYHVSVFWEGGVWAKILTLWSLMFIKSKFENMKLTINGCQANCLLSKYLFWKLGETGGPKSLTTFWRNTWTLISQFISKLPIQHNSTSVNDKDIVLGHMIMNPYPVLWKKKLLEKIRSRYSNF